MKTFYHLLINALIVATKNNFVWFAITYWLYLETKSVTATGILGGTYLVLTAISSFWLGSLVDRYRKKQVMLGSSIATLVLFAIGLGMYLTTPPEVFTQIQNLRLWSMVVVLMVGVMMGSIFQIAIPTLVTVLVPEDKRDKANGMFGTVMGISFAITSVASGISLARLGLGGVIAVAIALTVAAILHLLTVPIVEKQVIHTQGEQPSQLDIKGTITAIKNIPGLFALIFYTTFNNFLGGAFMALMDAYGLSLVSVEVWGLLWGFLSTGFIIGGIIISRKGVGSNPLRTLFRINTVTWIVCMLFTIQPSIVLLSIGMFIWVCLFPFIEAIEQTIIQKVVPPNRQGRVFGFAHSVEQAASPLTAFLIGPITQHFFIPFMTTGEGVNLIGDWFGTGPGRGIALVFTLTGIIGFIVTQIARYSKSYSLLARRYKE